MSTTPTQIRIDKDIKEQVVRLFSDLGIDMSTAVNIFLRQCLLHDGLPFNVEKPQYNKATLQAMEEALKISRDSNVPAYDDLKDLKAALEK